MPSIRVLQIRPNSDCRNHCAFCATADGAGQPNMTLGEIATNLDWFRSNRGVNEVVLSGGEVTAREDFADLVELLRSRHLKLVTVISNGQSWSRERVAACRGAIDRVVISLSPQNAADWGSAGGPTGRARSSVVRLQEAGIRVQTNTVMLRTNLGVLEEVASQLREWNVFAPTLTFLYPFGSAAAARQQLVPSWSEAGPLLLKLLATLEPLGPKIKNIPPCYLGEAARFCSKTTQRFLVEARRQLENHALIPPFVGMEFFEPCDGCPSRPRCDGFWRVYLENDVFPALSRR